MLKILRRGQRIWTAVIVFFVGGVFAVFIGLGGPLQGGSGNAVVQVGPYRIGIAEFERTRAQRENQLRETLGEQFDARALRETLDTVTARLLIERGILALEAERMGLTVAKQEVERQILALPDFRDETGRFDKESFDRWVSYEFGSERAFREQQGRSALAAKLLRVIRAQASVSEAEAREAVQSRLRSVRIAYTILDTTAAPEDFPRDEARIAQLLAEREEEARALYEERADVYDVRERTRARHILLRVGQGSTEEEKAAIRKRAEEVLERLQGGEEFAAVAEEVSEDPGSKANGGDLGFFPRGQMVPAFEEVAFSLEPGSLSGAVETEYGFHVIRVEERTPAELKTFEQVRDDLAHELLGREEGRLQARATAERLAEAVRGGQTLEQSARAEELTLERSGLLRRRPDGFVPGLGAAQELMAVAFTLAEGESSDRIFEVGDKLALVQVLERKEPGATEIEAEVEAERQRLAARKFNDLTETWVGQRRAELTADGELHVNLQAAGRRG